MPKSEVIEQEKWKLPKETPLPAVLNSVEEKKIPYTNKSGKADEFVKWTWEFEITDGEYEGLRAWGDTDPRITTENNVRHWAEAISGADYDLGDGLDTDDLLGLPCVIEVDNTTYEKKSGDISYLTPVINVLPANATDEPPF